MKNVSNDTQHESEKNKKNGLIEKNKWIGIGIIAGDLCEAKVECLESILIKHIKVGGLKIDEIH